MPAETEGDADGELESEDEGVAEQVGQGAAGQDRGTGHGQRADRSRTPLVRSLLRPYAVGAEPKCATHRHEVEIVPGHTVPALRWHAQTLGRRGHRSRVQVRRWQCRLAGMLVAVTLVASVAGAPARRRLWPRPPCRAGTPDRGRAVTFRCASGLKPTTSTTTISVPVWPRPTRRRCRCRCRQCQLGCCDASGDHPMRQ